MEYAKWIEDENLRHSKTLMDLYEVFTKEMDNAGLPHDPPKDETAN